MTFLPRPKFSPAEAVARAQRLVGSGVYQLGATDQDADRLQFDCTAFSIRYAYGLPGHRPGFNRGWGVSWSWGTTATVEDDINSNSAIEDAAQVGDLFRFVSGAPMPGDIMAYPTIRLAGHQNVWVGHAAIVESVDRARGHWDWANPAFDLLDMIECHGPDGTNPSIRRATGAVFAAHSATWPKPIHRSWLLRVSA